MSARILAITGALLAVVCRTAHADADVYRWVDERGGIHYSDRWVPGSELIRSSKPHPPNPEAEAARRAAEQSKLQASNDHVANQLGQQAAVQAVKQDVAKAREQQCKDAKEKYEKAIQARRIYTTNKAGEREYISDEQADSYRLQARNEVQSACGSVKEPTVQ
ncbi:MAG TPA: DUF4124 domain-containing protein [Steroidobacteraceae bacterium]|nr:DUF4124 domain-containing protein [Steroidobacteraceae bacterium]